MALRAASFLAGELLRDKCFSPGRSMMTKASHSYLIDLPGNDFHVEASIFSTVGGKSSLFRVQVKGPIRGDKFAVVDPVTKDTLFFFTRFEADKPGFFARDFLFLAQESRTSPKMSAEGQVALAHGVVELMLGIPVDGKTITVRIQKQAETMSADVKIAATNQSVMSVPLSALGNIAKLVEAISQSLSADASALRPTP